MKIGRVYATSDDPDAVRQGYYAGDGLLGEVIETVDKLQGLVIQQGWYSDSPQMLKAIEEARHEYFNALKAIEDAGEPVYEVIKSRDPAAIIADLKRWNPQEGNVREQLAELMHEMWAGWMMYLFTKCKQQDPGMLSFRDAVIPPWAVRRWRRQMGTPYDELSEEEKDNDRKEADKVLALIEKCIWEHAPGSLVDLPLFQSYYEKKVPADILQCHGCGKPSSSLTTWIINDDDGDLMTLWLCESCGSTRFLTEEYREGADCEEE